jgi:hypothetical protein
MAETNPRNAGAQPGRGMRVTVPMDLDPVFSNIVNINVNDEEVALQFMYVRPSTKEAMLVSEILMTPQHAIRFQRALDATIKRHFTRHLGTLQ